MAANHAKALRHARGSKLSVRNLRPMEAKLVDTLPQDGTWQFEPKWDGFRCLVFRDGKHVELVAKSGKPLGRYFPEIVATFAAVKPNRFVLDGELLISTGDTLSFDDLQMRLHPAQSRINKLSVETPALFMAFDILLDDKAQNYLDQPLAARREALEAQFKRFGLANRLRLSPFSRKLSDAQKWLAQAGAGALDGVIAKSLDGPYQPAERIGVSNGSPSNPNWLWKLNMIR